MTDQRDTFDASDWSVDDIADYQAGVFSEAAASQVRELIDRDPEARDVFDGLERTRRELARLGARYRDEAPPVDFIGTFFATHDPTGHNRAGWQGSLPADGPRRDPPPAPTTRPVSVDDTTASHSSTPASPTAVPRSPVGPVPGDGVERDAARPGAVRRFGRVPVAAAAAVLVLLGAVIAAVIAMGAGADSQTGTPTVSRIATGVVDPGRNNAISPDGQLLYLSNNTPRQIVIIDLHDGNQRTVPVGGPVQGITAGPRGATSDGSLYVSTTEPGPGGTRGALTKIDPATGTVEQTNQSGRQAGAVSITPDGTLLWSVDNEVAFLDSDGLSQFSSVGIGGRAEQIDIGDNGARAFVNVSGSVGELDLVTRTEAGRVNIPDLSGPLRVAVNPQRPLFAVSSNSPGVEVYTSQVDEPPVRISIGPSATMTWPRDGSQLYFTSRQSAEVVTVRADDLRAIHRIPVPTDPLDIVSRPDGTAVYVVYANEILEISNWST